MAAVWFSAMPSCMIFTVPVRNRSRLNSSRRATSSAVDTGIGLPLTAGFPPADAARLYLAFIDTVLSHAAAEAAFQALPPQQREADRRSWRDVYQGLDPATYPSLTAVRPELPAMADSSFEQAVDLLLEALAARARERR
ncbi:hypothetical protein [Streptomyces sp. NPDC046832]|uniref:hypothetical protein n=1 Tax=Streptomyces sp. NPDC046832 TaxID=3155020 RepID=UPI0033C6FF3C